MPVERALLNLSDQFAQMNRVLAELLAVARDFPEPIAMAEAIEQTIDDLQIALQEFYQRLALLTRLERPQEQTAEVWQTLLLSQQYIDQAESKLCALNSMDQLAPLWRHGLRQGGEWLDWARVVKDGLARCAQQVQHVRAAQLLSLQEMAERDASGLVTVNNRTIGQQVNIHDEQAQPGPHAMWS